MNIQQRIIKYMKDNDLNQYKMGDLLGLSQGTVSKIVNGGNLCPKNKEVVLAFLGDELNQDEEETSIEPNNITPELIKIPLETLEDILFELSQGSVIYCEISNHYLRLESGFIIRYEANGKPFSINSPILLDDFYYVEKEKQVKLEVGKKYMTKDGRVATVFAHTEDDRFLATFEGDTQVRSYPSNGVLDSDDKLVKEY